MDTVIGTETADDFTNTDSSNIRFSDTTFDLLAGDDTVRSAVMGDSTVLGGAGDDLLGTTSTTDSRFEGGLGQDVALFNYAQDQYEIVDAGTGLVEVTYIGAGAGDGYDRLLNIEVLSFADGDVIL